MRVVVALGGNALLKRGEPLNTKMQRRNIETAAAAVAAVAVEHEVIVTHGNGPQVGLLALQSQSYQPDTPTPFDVLGAESGGMIGYLLEQGLTNHLPGRSMASLLTQTLVDAKDPAFLRPSKFVGPIYEKEEAARLGREQGWSIRQDGAAYRRVVASPRPKSFLELDAIRCLVTAGFLVICAGGGGIPVVRNEAGRIEGVEGVIDKDRASALLARDLEADALVLLTDVSAVETEWGAAASRKIARASPKHLSKYAFADGSMGPKVEAACTFAEGGGRAAIGALGDAAEILRGEAGTTIDSDLPEIVFAKS